MGKLINISVALAFLLMIFFACEAPRSYPNTPEVGFKSLSIADYVDTLGNPIKLVKLTISVIDGDGDIGIKFDDNAIYPGFEDLDSANLFIKLFEKKEGAFQEVEFKLPLNYATPYLEPEGQDKTLKADIEIKFEEPLIDTFLAYDTIKYSFYIYDRALNKSNIAESPAVPSDTLGLIK